MINFEATHAVSAIHKCDITSVICGIIEIPWLELVF
jgi:hypothetical protein